MPQNVNSLHSIQENTVLRYLDKMWKILPFVFLACALVEAVLFIFVNGNPLIKSDRNYLIKQWSIIQSFLPTVLSFVFYFPCYWLYKNKKSNFHMKKTYYQAILYLSATAYIFIHVGYPCLLAMYLIPIVTSCAFSKTAVTRSLKYSTFFIILYAVFQTLTEKSSYYIPISVVTEMLVIFATLITLNINDQFHENFEKMIEAMNRSQELTDKLNTDTLTGCFTREKLEKDLESSDEDVKTIAFVDIDNFKSINDKFGHDKGDFVLVKFVQIMMSESVKIYRLGGDEFLITSSLPTEKLYKKLVYKTENFKYETKKTLGHSVTISCGIISVKEFSQTEINRADQMMYKIKRTSKNLVKVLDNSNEDSLKDL